MQTNTDFEANGFRNRWPAVYRACKFMNGFVWPFKEMELERTCYMNMYRFRTNEYFRVGRGDPYFATNPKNETHSGFDFGFGFGFGFGFARPPLLLCQFGCKQRNNSNELATRRVSAQFANLFGASPGTILRLASSGISLEQGRGKYRGGVTNHKSKNC